MYQLRIVSGSSYTQVSWSNSIDLISVVNICFAGIYISMCCTVDDCIRFYLFCQLHNSFNICNIQLCHICIHTFILSAVCIHLVDCPSQLTVTASHNNLLHILIIPFCLYTFLRLFSCCIAIYSPSPSSTAFTMVSSASFSSGPSQ